MITLSQAVNQPHSQESFDAVVVIISINIRHLDKRCTLIVSDDSLPCHETARILLSNLSESDINTLIQIKKRDIVRFNTLFVHKNYKLLVGRDSTTNAHLEQMTTIICDLNHKRMTDHYSLSFAKVGMSTAIAGGTILFETTVPHDLITPKERIMSIGNYFHYNHGRDMIMKETTHCEDRNIRDVRFPDLLSNVIVRVSQIGLDETSNDRWSKMKKFQTRTQTRTILTDGLGIQDDEDTIPFILDSNSLLLADLRLAFRQQTTIIIRDVLTKKSESDRWSHNTGYYLVSTSNTTVEEYDVTSKRARIGTYESPHTYNWTLSCLQSASFSNSQSHEKRSIMGCITLIEIKETNTRLEKHGEWPELLKLHQCLVGESDYLPAIITITLQGTYTSIKVRAPCNIMTTLCGGFTVNASKKKHNIQNISKLLRGFMTFQIPLEWIIQDNADIRADFVPIVEEVNLLSMDF